MCIAQEYKSQSTPKTQDTYGRDGGSYNNSSCSSFQNQSSPDNQEHHDFSHLNTMAMNVSLGWWFQTQTNKLPLVHIVSCKKWYLLATQVSQSQDNWVAWVVKFKALLSNMIGEPNLSLLAISHHPTSPVLCLCCVRRASLSPFALVGAYWYPPTQGCHEHNLS